MSEIMRRRFLKQGIVAAGAIFILPQLNSFRNLSEAFSSGSNPSSTSSGSLEVSGEKTSGDKISSLGFSNAMVSRNFWNAKSFEGNAYFVHYNSPNSLQFISRVTHSTMKSPSAATIGYPSIYYGRFGPGNTTSGEKSWLPMPMTLSDFVSNNLVSEVSYSVSNPSGMPFNLFYDLWCGSHELAISMYSYNRPPPGTKIATITLSSGSSWNVYRLPSDTKGYTELVIRPQNDPEATGTSSINLSEMLSTSSLGLDYSSTLQGIGFGGEFLPNGSDLNWKATSWTLSSGSNSLTII
jgi:Glycosyl hydrolase family 12